MLYCALQSSSEFRLELDPAKFPSIPKEFNMRPHADGVQDAYCFNRQSSGSIGAPAEAVIKQQASMQPLLAMHAPMSQLIILLTC